MRSTQITSGRDRLRLSLIRCHISFSTIIVLNCLLFNKWWHHIFYLSESIYIFQDAPVQFVAVAIFDYFWHRWKEFFVSQLIWVNFNLISVSYLFNQVFFEERNHVPFILRQHNSWNEFQCPKLLIDVANVKFITQFFQRLLVDISPSYFFLVFF